MLGIRAPTVLKLIHGHLIFAANLMPLNLGAKFFPLKLSTKTYPLTACRYQEDKTVFTETLVYLSS